MSVPPQDAPLPDADSPGSARLRQTRESLTLQFAGFPAVQSSMSLLNPYALEIQYTRLMMGFLLFDSTPGHILMIGLGGGSLAKFCHRYLPESRIDVVEIDPGVIALRDAFRVPPDDGRFRVIQADGRDHLQAGPEPADVLLVDAYDGQGMPPALCEQSFFDACHAALADEGILVVNLHLESETYPACLAGLREVFGTALFEVIDDDMTNSIVFACKGERFDETDLGAGLHRPSGVSKDAWRQLLPTFRLIEATLTLR